MLRNRLTFVSNSRETTVVLFSLSRSTPDLGGRAAKVLRKRKLEQKAYPILSDGADPGPAGFDWEELKSTDDQN
jgi:hypothetical protein